MPKFQLVPQRIPRVRPGRFQSIILRKKVLKHPKCSVSDNVKSELYKLVLEVDQGLFVPPPVVAMRRVDADHREARGGIPEGLPKYPPHPTRMKGTGGHQKRCGMRIFRPRCQSQ